MMFFAQTRQTFGVTSLFHGEGDAVATVIDLGDADADVLMEFDDIGGMADELVG